MSFPTARGARAAARRVPVVKGARTIQLMRTRSHVYDVRGKSNKADKVTAIGVAPARINSVISCVGYDDLSAAGAIRVRQSHRRTAMRAKLLTGAALLA